MPRITIRHRVMEEISSNVLNIRNPSPNDLMLDAENDGIRGSVPGSVIFVAFEPTQIKSATDNRGTFDSDNPDITFSVRAVQNLGAVHSISPDKLLEAEKLGGMPVPSVAVTRLDQPYSWGGDDSIYLIGRPGMIDPKRGAEVYSRDAWTGKMPYLVHKAVGWESREQTVADLFKMEDVYQSREDSSWLHGLRYYIALDYAGDKTSREDVERCLRNEDGKALFAWQSGYRPRPKMRNAAMKHAWMTKALRDELAAYESLSEEEYESRAGEVRQKAEEAIDAYVGGLYAELEKKKPEHFAVRQYKKYKLAAGKTAKSILISCGARLAPFDIQELRDLTMYDELQLDTLGDKKTALFLIMSDTDSTFNFLISMVYTQLFNLLCDKADDVYGGKLPIHVRCLIDECANIGQIPNLEKLVATIRSREISACLVLQARSQLKAIYKDNADTIVGNMDSQIFLGGSEPTTLKDLSEMLGKETIDAFNTSDTRGNSPSYGTTFQKMGHELLSRDELAVLDGGKCILQLRGVRPFLSDKYDLTQHPNYKLTSDYDPKNTFDIEKYLNRKEKINPNDAFVVIDADSLPSA